MVYSTILIVDEVSVIKFGRKVTKDTAQRNNLRPSPLTAEYLGMIAAGKMHNYPLAFTLGLTQQTPIYGDCKTAIAQNQAEFAIKNQYYSKLRDKYWENEKKLGYSPSISHIPREKNWQADVECNLTKRSEDRQDHPFLESHYSLSEARPRVQ